LLAGVGVRLAVVGIQKDEIQIFSTISELYQKQSVPLQKVTDCVAL
jgi:hypothetical protein